MKRKKHSAPAGREKRLQAGEDLLWGIHPVAEALREEPERMAEIFLLKEKGGSKWEEIITGARARGIKLSFVEKLSISGQQGARHQGIAAKMNSTPLMPFEELAEQYAEKVRRGGRPKLILCDSLQDPHNVGAIIRSAYAAGFDGVVTTRENSAPLGGAVAKSSAGAISHIPVSQVTNLAAALQRLKKAGGWIFGTVKDNSAQSLYETDLRLPACIVVGSEGKGVRPLVRKQCDILLSIPMQGRLDSLNSSVAAAVIMFEAMRQKLP